MSQPLRLSSALARRADSNVYLRGFNGRFTHPRRQGKGHAGKHVAMVRWREGVNLNELPLYGP
jgi:hypothetical protein